SAFVALTLTPMLATKLIRGGTHEGWLYRKTEPFFQVLNAGYRRALNAFLRRRWVAPLVIVACGAFAWMLFQQLPRELAPPEDRSGLRLRVTAPEGTGYESLGGFMDQLDARIMELVPEAFEITSYTSPSFGSGGSTNSGFIRMTLIPADQRTRSQQEIAAQLR